MSISEFFSNIRSRRAADVLTFKIAKLEFKSGDILVLKTDGALSMDQVARLKQAVASISPDLKTFVLDRGFDIAVLSGDKLEFSKKSAEGEGQ